MNHNKLVFFVILICVTGFSLVKQVDDVYACTLAPGPTLREDIESAPIIVHGQIIESDLAQQNYVLQINEYLTQEIGPPFLMLNRNNPREIQALVDTNAGGGDCRLLYNPFPLLEEGYFILGSTGLFGTHWINSVFWDGNFPYTNLYDSETETIFDLEQDEFEQMVFDIRNSQPVQPLELGRYPATAPLLLTDEVGNEYILPATGFELISLDEDSSRLYMPWSVTEYSETGYDTEDVECDSWDCLIVTPDNRTLIVDMGEDYAYIQLTKIFRFTAEYFTLSPTGLAVWEDDTLQIVALHDSQRFFSDGDVRLPRVITQIERGFGDIPVDSRGIWDETGSLLAFSDTDGLWLWNPYNEASEPRLLVEANEDGIPTALEFAGQSRYLSIEHGEERYILDLVTQDRLPFGYISPDGQFFLTCPALDSIDDVCDLQIQQLAPTDGFSRSFGWIFANEWDAEWVHSRHIVASACDYIDEICGVIDADGYSVNFDRNNYHMIMLGGVIEAIDYAVQGRNVAILNDGYTLTVNGDELTFDLDSPLVEVRWLPSLFYGEAERPPLLRPILAEDDGE